MSTPQVERLQGFCQRLRLQRIGAELSSLLEQAAKRDLAYSDFLDEVLGREVEAKQEKHLTMRVSMARFPFHKTLEAFEWAFQPSIDPKVIKELATGRFLSDGENIPTARAPRRRQDAPRRRPRTQGLRARPPDLLHHRGRADRHAGEGPLRESAGGAA